MLDRELHPELLRRLSRDPVTALLGPRQVGKTTLARQVAAERRGSPVYLDLELSSDLARLSEPELYLRSQAGRLVILDEIQRKPELFPLLRSLVDQRLHEGERAGHFLVLGSASRDLLQQSSESLAGRISYLELRPLSPGEVGPDDEAARDRLWLHGGFPPSYLAPNEEESWNWRTNFLDTYVQRDLPQLRLRLPAEQLRRLWEMLAHLQGEALNSSRLAANLGVNWNTVRRYLDVLTDLFMLRQLPAFTSHAGKRLVKSPRVYVRDSGLLHRLLRIPDADALAGHPVVGKSWEGFVIESILNALPDSWEASYFRSSGGAEIDLILRGPRKQVLAIEIKRTLSPRVRRGFRDAADEVGATQCLFVIPDGQPWPLADGVEAMGLAPALRRLAETFEPRPTQPGPSDGEGENSP